MKGNLTKAEDYIDFLKDNEIIDFSINIFNYVAFHDMIDLADECLK